MSDLKDTSIGNIRNIAIIAHVDHGKTTLVNEMLVQCGTFHERQDVVDRVMDSNDLEKERGITILAKCTSVNYHGTKINIIDTPGHADFGGEVERIMSMVDGVVVLVDAFEGPMPQTKFVLGKALSLGLKPIVLINKIDRPDARPDEVLNEIFDLFVVLDANEDQLDFPVLYASGRNGWSVNELEDEKKNLNSLFDSVVENVSVPKIMERPEFSMLVTTLEYDTFLGRILTGKIYSGEIKVNQIVKVLDVEGGNVEQNVRITKLFLFDGLERKPVESASAGSIIVIAGLKIATVSNTICDPEIVEPLYSKPIDPPTMSVTISVNDSPLCGLEGKKVTSTLIRDRLMNEAEGNVAIKVTESAGKDAYEVGGRGELQIGVLIENMRREGFELSVSRPKILFQTDENDKKLEPMEEVIVDVDEEYSGVVVEKLLKRKGELVEIKQSHGGKSRVLMRVPSRGMIGYQGEFLTDTKGTGVLNRVFDSYVPYRGDINNARNGVLIASTNGNAVAYAIFNLQERGTFFIGHNTKVYQGMIVGLHNRDNDLEINVTKGKQLTNMRASGKDEAVKLTVPKVIELEMAMPFIGDDELVEVTPENIRLRKRFLDANQRKRQPRN